MAQQQDDKELLQQFKNPVTKEKAFTAIVKKYQEKLYWHIRRMVVDHEDANDVLQNMFIKVWKNLDNFREDSQLYTWLYRIATNESLTFLEQAKKRNTISLSGDAENHLANKLQSDKNFDGKNQNGNCSWPYSNCPKNKGPFLICVILMKCPMKR